MKLQDTVDITLEGFMDMGNDEIEDWLCMMVKPVVYQYEDAGTGTVAQLVEDFALDYVDGEVWENDPYVSAPMVRRQFTKTTKKNTPRFEYWKRVVRIYGENDPNKDRMYATLDGVGDQYDYFKRNETE